MKNRFLPMRVGKDRVVGIEYELKTSDGQPIESSANRGPLRYIVGRGALIPGLDPRIEGLDIEDEREFDIPPEDAFGRVGDGPTLEMKRTEFPANAKLDKGLRFQATLPGAGLVMLEVLEPGEAAIKVRASHPLAGRAVKLRVKVIELRDATPKELETGQVTTGGPVPPPPPRK